MNRKQHGGSRESGFPAVLPEFQPVRSLWEGPGAPFACEQAARWQLRQLRPLLIEAGALARPRGRLFVHPQRFVKVYEQAAVAAAQRRDGTP